MTLRWQSEAALDARFKEKTLGNIRTIGMIKYCTIKLCLVDQAKPFPCLDVPQKTVFFFVSCDSLQQQHQQQEQQQQSSIMSNVLNHVNGNNSRAPVNERQQVERRLSIINHDIDTKKAAIKNIRLLLQQTSVTE